MTDPLSPYDGMPLRILSYDEFGELVTQLANKVRQSKQHFDYVYGLPRSGKPIAVQLSHHLDVPYTDMLETHRRILVVDDISDTGNTLLRVLPRVHNCCIATLFMNPRTKCVPHYYVEQSTDWIRFPWELARTDRVVNRTV